MVRTDSNRIDNTNDHKTVVLIRQTLRIITFLAFSGHAITAAECAKKSQK
jgi:hypothetical protein